MHIPIVGFSENIKQMLNTHTHTHIHVDEIAPDNCFRLWLWHCHDAHLVLRSQTCAMKTSPHHYSTTTNLNRRHKPGGVNRFMSHSDPISFTSVQKSSFVRPGDWRAVSSDMLFCSSLGYLSGYLTYHSLSVSLDWSDHSSLRAILCNTRETVLCENPRSSAHSEILKPARLTPATTPQSMQSHSDHSRFPPSDDWCGY